MARILLTFALSLLASLTSAQNVHLDTLDASKYRAKYLRYWFDDDASSLKTEGLGTGMHTIDASSLSNGLHTLHYQAVADDGSLQGVRSVTFLAEMYKKDDVIAAKSLRYWFDGDASTVKEEEIGAGVHLIDASMLSEGLHTLHYQVIADGGSIAGTHAVLFLTDMREQIAAKSLRYWFDDDASSLKTEELGTGMHTIDASSLSNGLHTLHYQAVADDGSLQGVRSVTFLAEMYKKDDVIAAKSLRYWFDGDASTVKEEEIGTGVHLIDASMLPNGLHMLHYQVIADGGSIAGTHAVLFLTDMREQIAAKSLRYWFDDDASSLMTEELGTGMHTIDASSLSNGLHTLHYQAVAGDGSLQGVRSVTFLAEMYKKDDVIAAKSLRYWFDDDASTVKEEEIGTGVHLIDASMLSEGLHMLHYQVVTEDESIAGTHAVLFLADMHEQIAAKSLRYWFDDDASSLKTEELGTGMHNIDASSLSNGLHCVHYQIIGADGLAYMVQSKVFLMLSEPQALGLNKIVSYEYWVNDGYSDRKKANVPEPSKEILLTALLPLETQPFRSSSFQLDTKGDKLMMYAKNDIHMRFFDALGYWSDDKRSFVDRSVSREVTDVADLLSTQTFERTAENDVKWFSFYAAPGDTIAFKASQAMTIQAFAPSGKEIYTASGDKSVVCGGTHTWEEGTHYLAVHDVMGSKPNITLDYFHMDKYAVVDQDVRVVGNGGCSTITFQGNGFRDLYAVDLKDSKGNILESIDVGHESDASTTVIFDFTDARLGKYNAIFHFTEEDKVVTNCITVEEAKEVELSNSMSFNGTFLVGTDAVFTLKMKNNGNMTAYNVPVQIEVRTPESIKDIHHIKVSSDRINEYDTPLPKYEDVDSLLQNVVKDNLPKLGSLSDFFVLVDENGEEYYRAEYLMTLPPNSETTLTTSVGCPQTTEVYFIVPSEWAAVSYKPLSSDRKIARVNVKDAICCNKERIRCVANVANFVGSFTAYGCATSIANELIELTLDGMCPDEEQLKRSLKSKVTSIANSILNAGIDCITSHFDEVAKGIRKALKGLEDNINGITKQISKLSAERESAYQSYRYFKSQAEASSDNFEIYNRLMNEADAAYDKGRKLDEEILSLGNEKNKLLAEQANKNKELKDVSDRLADAIKDIRNSIANMLKATSCYKAFKERKDNCPPPFPGGGSSSPVNSSDPNDIFGYVAESGSRYVGEEVLNLPYRIEFENDTTFATAAAHTVVVKDTLDAMAFDLSTYQPTSIKIGDKDVQLKGGKEFITTVDMRPEINAIAQVEGKYDAQKGVATWTFTSLDPMTMEPTDDVMQGFLPVNYDGRGIGEVAFNINRRSDLPDGTEIKNRASIVFDTNDAILTPVWTNIIDAVPPTSRVCDLEVVNDTIVRVQLEGDDNRSGIWKYALYVQYGEGASWNQVAETDTTCFDFRYFEDIDYGFCVVATDSAGNVEKKIIEREYTFLNGDVVDCVSMPRGSHDSISRAYDLSGRLIQEEGYRGILIKNRRKMLKR